MVRNAHGTIHDVNEVFAVLLGRALGADQAVPVPLHLFPASGFAPEAQRYALAQQISLVDLSGSGFAELIALPSWASARSLRRALGTWTGGFDRPVESDETDAQDEWIPYEEISPYMTVVACLANQVRRCFRTPSS